MPCAPPSGNGYQPKRGCKESLVEAALLRLFYLCYNRQNFRGIFMATITATPGIKTQFDGASDDVVCVISPAAQNGVQVEAQGFHLANCTIQAAGASSTGLDTIPFSESARHVGVIGSTSGCKTSIGRVRISGAPSGTNFVTIIPL